MNNFTTATQQNENNNHSKQIPKHLETLATTVFQSLFPPINPTATPLKGIKRVLLLDRVPQKPDDDRASYVLNVRHYAIEARTAKSLPKALRRIDTAKQRLSKEKRSRGHMPNLGRLDDVADYLLDPHAADGFTSGSDSEPDTDAEVEVLMADARKVRSRANLEKHKNDRPVDENGLDNVHRKGIKLHELGPRMKLRLTKVEEGLCAGKVMWHEWIHKTKQEQAAMEKVHEARRQAKARRKAEQKANIERKKAERKARGQPEENEDEEEEEDLDDDWEDDLDEDGDAEMAG